VLVLVIHNPSSGSSALSENELRSVFERAGHEIRYRTFADETWKSDLRNVTDAIVVAGGDGTVRRVAIALSSSGRKTSPLVIVPVGTANNLARHVGAEGPASRIAVGLATARRDSMAVGLLQKPGMEGARFLESAGLGLFTHVLRQADDTETVGGGLKLLREAVERTDPQLVRIDADGTDLTGEYVMVEAMNVGSIGPRLMLAPGADHTDNELDLVLVRPSDRHAVLEYLDALEGGGNAAFPVAPYRVRLIRLDWERGHVDDMPWPSDEDTTARSGEITIEVERHLTVLIP
jgi:diacylglycerol kinase family enzyme